MSAPKASIEPIKRPPSLHHTVQQSIKSYIIDNSLQAGDSLPSENELSKLLNVSRNLVREAVRGLEALGIVDIRRGSGLFVSNFTLEQLMVNIDYSINFELQELKEIYVVRRALETGMVADAIKAKTKDRENELSEILDMMRTKAENGQQFPEEDRRFHQCLFEPLQNDTLLRILDAFWLTMNKAHQTDESLIDHDPFWTYELHIPIVEAFVAGDVSAAGDALFYHHANLEKRLYGGEDKDAD